MAGIRMAGIGVSVIFLKQPMKHRADGSDPSAGGQKDGIASRMLQYKEALGSGGPHLHTFVEFAQPGCWRILGAMTETELKTIVFARSRRNRIRRWCRTFVKRKLNRNRLPGQKFQHLFAFHPKGQMMSA